MIIVRESKNVYTVGIYIQGNEALESEWIPLRDFEFKGDAIRFINYLNGGIGHVFCEE